MVYPYAPHDCLATTHHRIGCCSRSCENSNNLKKSLSIQNEVAESSSLNCQMLRVCLLKALEPCLFQLSTINQILLQRPAKIYAISSSLFHMPTQNRMFEPQKYVCLNPLVAGMHHTGSFSDIGFSHPVTIRRSKMATPTQH